MTRRRRTLATTLDSVGIDIDDSAHAHRARAAAITPVRLATNCPGVGSSPGSASSNTGTRCRAAGPIRAARTTARMLAGARPGLCMDGEDVLVFFPPGGSWRNR